MSEFLGRTLDLARTRGYLDCPEVGALKGRVPDWFRDLGTDRGLAEFEARRGFVVPAAVREFYRSPELACFMEAAVDGEVFLRQLAADYGNDMPPVAEFGAESFLIVSFHAHSGMVLAVEFGRDDPRPFAGWDGDPEPVEADPGETFSEMLFRVVAGHEAKLDDWQATYEKCKADPAEARRLGGVEWVRTLPGMSARLGRP